MTMWVKHPSLEDTYYIFEEYEFDRIRGTVNGASAFERASRFTKIYGYNSIVPTNHDGSPASSEGIKEHIVRIETRRAKLVADVANAVVESLKNGAAIVAPTAEEIALAVQEQLVDEFKAVNDNVDDQPTEFVITPK